MVQIWEYNIWLTACNSFIYLFLTDVDPLNRRQVCGGSQYAIERMLQFGRDLHTMSVELKRDYGTNSANKKMLQVCVLCKNLHLFFCIYVNILMCIYCKKYCGT